MVNMKKLMTPLAEAPYRKFRKPIVGLALGAAALATVFMLFKGKEPMTEQMQSAQTQPQARYNSEQTVLPKKHRKPSKKIGFLDRLKAANEKGKEEELVRRTNELLDGSEDTLHRKIESFDFYLDRYNKNQQNIRIIEVTLRITHGSSNSDLIESNSDSIYFLVGEIFRGSEGVPDHLRASRGELFINAEVVRSLIAELDPQNLALADLRLRASELLQEMEGCMSDLEGLVDSIGEQLTDLRRLELITRKICKGKDYSEEVINPLYVDALAGVEERGRGLGIN